MILKSLSFTGFKSFSDKTSINLSENLNVVVGPNGSGKSNIVDAIAWVLGTQSPGALRTNKMEDVIFAGTEKLPEKGFAEVSILFDSIDKEDDSSEISISRKLFRDGTSEYFMNGLDCRLLDIQEFLNENGIGKQQHTIISQGQITNVLNSKPEEHRETLEQASGVYPFKIKKEKALKRIESGEAEIKRAKDVLREIKKQIKPLEVQAKKAKEHEKLTKELDQMKLYKDYLDHEDLEKKKSHLEEKKEEILKRIKIDEMKIDKSKNEKSKLKNEAGDGSKIYTLLNNHISDLQSIIDKYIGITQIANERRTYKERLKKENEILCSRTKEKINKNQSEIDSSSRKALNHSKQISEYQYLINKREKEILDLEKMSAASKEVSEAILEKEIEYLKSQYNNLEKYKQKIKEDKIHWEVDRDEVEEKNVNHKILLDEIQQENFKEVVDTFNQILNREIRKVYEDQQLTENKLTEINSQIGQREWELEQYKSSDDSKVKEGIEKQRESLITELNQLKESNSNLTDEMIKLKEKISGLSSENSNLEGSLNGFSYDSINREIDELYNISSQSKVLSEQVKIAHSKLKMLSEEYVSSYGKTDSKLSHIDTSIDSLYESLSDLKEEYGSISIQYSEISNTLNNSQTKLSESNLSKTELLSELLIEDESQVNTKIRLLEEKLIDMGNVNYLAKDDYDDLKKRFDEINNTLDDLANAKKHLLKHIEEIDNEISLRIETAFNAVSINFSEIFNILFPGGKGSLSLTNKENILESGIDITAQPRGKKVKKISLLSGGERSLAAIAFLFAIFKSYPSPFYILDEVEAALDDANLHRMLNLLEEFKKEAQFIIVTHQQQTMQIGDVLYGVTMEPGSGSRVYVKSKEQFISLVNKGA
tara:strand:+ start:1956 stop:4595 length:2640 start_codon:yes stop_codon:yes gene_type:complete